jgi:hypothetical protein
VTLNDIYVLINTGITEQLFKVEKKTRYSFEFDNFTWWIGLDYGVYGNFQQYFSYIGVVSFIGGGSVTSHWQTLSHNVVSGNMYWLHI